MPGVKHNILWFFLFAAAMAFVEAAVVIHLRSLYYPSSPLAVFPLTLMSHRDLVIELAREFATVVMILVVALVSERKFIRNFAAFVFVLGLWDIFYYAWLKMILGWPTSWLEWDVLFLIPWPWFAPWIAPVLIALLFCAWGAWVLLSHKQFSYTPTALALFLLGTALSLVSFLLPAAALLPNGEEAFRGFEPDHFSWSLFLAGYLLIMISLLNIARHGRS
jgi:hypothetical protein